MSKGRSSRSIFLAKARSRKGDKGIRKAVWCYECNRPRRRQSWQSRSPSLLFPSDTRKLFCGRCYAFSAAAPRRVRNLGGWIAWLPLRLAKKAAIRWTTNSCSSARSSGKIGRASTSSAARCVRAGRRAGSPSSGSIPAGGGPADSRFPCRYGPGQGPREAACADPWGGESRTGSRRAACRAWPWAARCCDAA